MIQSFYCRGFRNVKCTDLKVANNNILIGENSSGKTNFLCALAFVYNMVSKPMIERTGFLSEVSRNSWNIANKFSGDNTCSFHWVFELGGKTFEYGLKFHTGEKREDFYILVEELKVNGVEYINTKGNVGYFSTGDNTEEKLIVLFDNTETILLQFNGLLLKSAKMSNNPFIMGEIRSAIEELEIYLKNGVMYYSCSDFNIKEICRDRGINDVDLVLNEDGSNFVNVFRRLQNSGSEFKNIYIQKLWRFGVNINNIRINEYNDKVWMEIGEKWVYLPLEAIGRGTIHLMLLLLIMCQKKSASLLLLEEPETNLSILWNRQLADEILNSHNFQCFVSTHSSGLYSNFMKNYTDREKVSFVCKLKVGVADENITGGDE